MRVATYHAGNETSWGVVRGERVSDARAVVGAPRSVRHLLEQTDHSRWLRALADPGVRAFALDDVQLLAPLEPRQDLIALGLNYKTHVAETSGATKQAAPPKQPILFGKAASSVTGPDAEVCFDPAVTSQVDWEVELAVVIGSPARYLASPEDAAACIAGYAISNDVSEREFQLERGGQWDKGKNCETFNPLGPWILTADEVADPQALGLRLRVNGQSRQDSSTKEMIFGVHHLVWYLSQFMVLRPGDVINTGTPAGVALGQPDKPYLCVGDVVELEIDGLGRQRQTFGQA